MQTSEVGRSRARIELLNVLIQSGKTEARTGLMDEAAVQVLRNRIEAIRDRRPSIEKLLDRTDLGTLRVDVNQALEEIDDLLDDYGRTFPQ